MPPKDIVSSEALSKEVSFFSPIGSEGDTCYPCSLLLLPDHYSSLLSKNPAPLKDLPYIYYFHLLQSSTIFLVISHSLEILVPDFLPISLPTFVSLFLVISVCT